MNHEPWRRSHDPHRAGSHRSPSARWRRVALHRASACCVTGGATRCSPTSAAAETTAASRRDSSTRARSCSRPTAPPATARPPGHRRRPDAYRRRRSRPSTSRSAPAACRCRRRARRPSRSRCSSPRSRSPRWPPTSRRSAPAPRIPDDEYLDGDGDVAARRRAVPHQLRDVPQRGRRRRRAHRGQVRPGAHGRHAPRTSTRRWSPARRTCRSSTT